LRETSLAESGRRIQGREIGARPVVFTVQRSSSMASRDDGYGRERYYVRPKASRKTKEGQKQSDSPISAELLTKYKYTNFIFVQ